MDNKYLIAVVIVLGCASTAFCQENATERVNVTENVNVTQPVTVTEQIPVTEQVPVTEPVTVTEQIPVTESVTVTEQVPVTEPAKVTQPPTTEESAREASQSIDTATATAALTNNLIEALSSLANASHITGLNVSRSAALIIRGLVSNTFELAGAIVYIPRLIFLDGPTQMIETLRLMRTNELRAPSDMDSAIDTILTFARQFRESGISTNLEPIVNFFPNIFANLIQFI